MDQSQETQIAVLQEKVNNLDGIVREVKKVTERIENKLDDTYVKKDDFIFWRNILISGILLTLAIGLVLNLLKK